MDLDPKKRKPRCWSEHDDGDIRGRHLKKVRLREGKTMGRTLHFFV